VRVGLDGGTTVARSDCCGDGAAVMLPLLLARARRAWLRRERMRRGGNGVSRWCECVRSKWLEGLNSLFKILQASLKQTH
jgi:hypothetical protein